MAVREISCRSLLNLSRLPGAAYVINPYTGCQNSCAYCYANFMSRYSGHNEPWGDWVDVKVNALEVLERELKKARKDSVLLSSVCDPYQPLERKYMLTRKILSKLLEKDFPVDILTKSMLVLRDLDLIRRFSRKTVGMTITGLDERDRMVMEPFASSHSDRIMTLRTLKEAGIETYAFVGPILPGLTDVDKVFSDLSGKVKHALVDKLNMHACVAPMLDRIAGKDYPQLLNGTDWHSIRERVREAASRNGIKVNILF
jgi:DNA repair photolyase